MQRLKFMFVICFSSMLLTLHAQGKETLFFQPVQSLSDTVSTPKTETVLTDSIKKVIHNLQDAVQANIRTDDVVWSKTIYRIIDMREKQNFSLYFPLEPQDGMRNLMTIMLDGVINKTLTVYKKGLRDDQFRPNFSPNMIVPYDSTDYLIHSVFSYKEGNDIFYPALHVENGKLAIDNMSIDEFMKRQQRFLIKEVWFFDKHRSVQESRILAIAPLLSYPKDNSSLIKSIVCWFNFDELRQAMAEAKIYWGDNQSSDMTMGLFFDQRLFSGYILGVDDIYHRTLLDYLTNEEDIRKEQNKIKESLIDFENDLWEY
jgi:gliding motility associated protien GldN